MSAIDNKDLYSVESLFEQSNTTSSFDFVELLSKIIKYWYLFPIFGLIAFGLAYFKNKSWTPTYKSITTILIEESRSNMKGDLTTGFSTLSSLGPRNFGNQMLMYNSHSAIARAVAKLNLSNEIYEKDFFKTTVLYRGAPITILSHYIADNAYHLEFRIRGLSDDHFEISFEGNDKVAPFRQEGQYGVSIQNALFFAEFNKSDYFVQPGYDLYFRFISERDLVNAYSSAIKTNILSETASVIEVGITGKVAQRDLDFLVFLNEQFFQDNLDRKNDMAERSIQFIERQISIIKNVIDSSEVKLNTYQSKSGIYIPNQSSEQAKVLETLDEKKNELRLRKEYLQYLSSYLNSPNKELLTDPSAFQISNPQLSSNIMQYNQLVLEMKNLGTGSPFYAKNMETMEELSKSIRGTIKTIQSVIAMEERDLTQRYEKTRSLLTNLPEQERQLLSHERDFKINDTYYMYLLQKRTESQIQKASNAPDNLIIDNPRVVGVVNGGEMRNTYIFYLAIGLLIPLIFVFIKEFLFKLKVQSKFDIEKITKHPIITIIDRSISPDTISFLRSPQSGFAEGFRTLRSRVESMLHKDSNTVLLLTSTEPKDGKTFVTMNLAAMYHTAGKKVLIVDCDLRHPASSKALGYENKDGLSNILIGENKIEDVICTTEYGFDLLPSGAVPPNPSEIIHSYAMKQLLEDLSKLYDYVLLDCSPVGLVTDSLYLVRSADMLLYVVRDEKTNKHFLKDTLKELAQDKVENIAIVYNDVNRRGSYYAYGKNSYHSKYHRGYYRES